jgi:hypothetical protein
MSLSGALLLMLASPAPNTTLSPEAEMAMTAWTVCQRQAQFVLAAGPASAESVAEEAMRSCEMDQLLFLAAWQTQQGDQAQTYVNDLRETFRLTGILKVRELRASTALADPIRIWSSCIGAHSLEKGADEPAETAADRALQSCVLQEDAVVAEAQRKLGPEYGPGVRLRFRADARDGIIRLITECRAAAPMSRPPECLQDSAAPM